MSAKPHRAPVLDRIAQELDLLRGRGLYRTLEAPRGAHFSSNDYLGLRHHPALCEAVRAAVERRGAGSAGSRLLAGHHSDWDALESAFAEFVGAEASLFFTSGYAANVGLLSAMLRPDDVVFSDAANHASLIDGIRLARCRKIVFPHLDMDFLADALRRDAGTGQRFIVVESVYSMDGDRAPIGALAELAERNHANLIVDEAHAVGVFGTRGAGLAEALAARGALAAAVYPCGKALASAGAFVAGNARLREWLVNRARSFVYSTAPPPYLAAQIGAAIGLVRDADPLRARLHAKAARLRHRLNNVGFETGSSDSQIVPVILGSTPAAVAAAAALGEAGYPVRPIRPPTVPEGAARLRLSVTADTPEASIDGLVDALCAWANKAERAAEAP